MTKFQWEHEKDAPRREFEVGRGLTISGGRGERPAIPVYSAQDPYNLGADMNGCDGCEDKAAVEVYRETAKAAADIRHRAAKMEIDRHVYLRDETEKLIGTPNENARPFSRSGAEKHVRESNAYIEMQYNHAQTEHAAAMKAIDARCLLLELRARESE